MPQQLSEKAAARQKRDIWLKIGLGRLNTSLNDLDIAVYWLREAAGDHLLKQHYLNDIDSFKNSMHSLESDTRRLLTNKRKPGNTSPRRNSAAKKKLR